MNIFDAIESLLEYGEKNSLFEKEDRVYCRNLILDVLHLDSIASNIFIKIPPDKISYFILYFFNKNSASRY